MALQTSGPISFSNLQTEFGGSHPITMGEYADYRVSGSGNTISMNQFYGASAYIPPAVPTSPIATPPYRGSSTYVITDGFTTRSGSHGYVRTVYFPTEIGRDIVITIRVKDADSSGSEDSVAWARRNGSGTSETAGPTINAWHSQGLGGCTTSSLLSTYQQASTTYAEPDYSAFYVYSPDRDDQFQISVRFSVPSDIPTAEGSNGVTALHYFSLVHYDDWNDDDYPKGVRVAVYQAD